MTVGCARCHDHKYDPIPTKDFYSLTGFFNSTDEPGFYAPGRAGMTPGPTLVDRRGDGEEDRRRAGRDRDRESAYERARGRPPRAGAEGRRAAGQNPDDLRRAIQRSLDARARRRYYPFDDTAPDFGGPAADAAAAGASVAAAARAPLVPGALHEQQRASGLGRNAGAFSEAAQPRPPEADGHARMARRARPRDDRVVSPSAGGDAPPGRPRCSADLREGRGEGALLRRQEAPSSARAWATTSGRSRSASTSG